jgi:uncharacterized protein (TIGR02646 family)
MILIRKPAVAPRILTDRGQSETARNRAAYEQDPHSYDTGASTFSFDSDIYGHENVKRTLIQTQHEKCCFCEAKITHIAYGDVEHFRPKAGYRQRPEDALGRPGYYWLAYDWINLYLSCQLCNQRFKKNTFPLIDDGRRCRNHREDLALEDPLFIDPGETDPEDHIEFVGEQPVAKDGSLRGLETIKALGLQREPLRERRFDRYRMLAALKNVALLMPDDPLGQQALGILADAVEDRAEYAAMARCLMETP